MQSDENNLLHPRTYKCYHSETPYLFPLSSNIGISQFPLLKMKLKRRLFMDSDEETDEATEGCVGKFIQVVF